MERDLPVSPWPEWEMVEKIGEGSFGRVYKAKRTEQGYSFYSAIKVISIPSGREEWDRGVSECGSEDAAAEYFRGILKDCIQEVATMEKFRGNSHVVSVEDFKAVEYVDEPGWELFIRMEFLTSFADYWDTKALTEEQVVDLGIDLCQALKDCAVLGIVHRDIKPENIFVSSFGKYKLGDFGIAREMSRTRGSFSRKGTDTYMAPELYNGQDFDARADIYSLGIVLYRLVNRNRLPFVSLEKQLVTYHDKENAVNRRLSGEEMTPPAECSKALSSVILKACSFDMESRYESAEEMLKDLMYLKQGRAHVLEEKEERKKRIKAFFGAGKERKDGRRRERAEEERRFRLKTILPWAAATSAVLLVLVLVGGFFVKRLLEDAVKEQTERMIRALQNQENVTKEIEGTDFASAITQIGERATIIVEKLADDRTEGEEGGILRYYGEDNELDKVLVYPAASAEGVYEEYYYWNDALFFAYIWNENTEEMYYYRDGMLIRWIDENGDVHDEENDNPEYTARGDRYWKNSVIQLANAMGGTGD